MNKKDFSAYFLEVGVGQKVIKTTLNLDRTVKNITSYLHRESYVGNLMLKKTEGLTDLRNIWDTYYSQDITYKDYTTMVRKIIHSLVSRSLIFIPSHVEKWIIS